jgi:LysM repeat protein
MRERRRLRSPARLLAPLALLLAIAATAFVVLNTTQSQGNGDDGDQSTKRNTEQRPREERRQQRRQQRPTYTVKLNDTLGLISEKTGVPVERLQTLNPELDPQNLVVGQKIKLRE